MMETSLQISIADAAAQQADACLVSTFAVHKLVQASRLPLVKGP